MRWSHCATVIGSPFTSATGVSGAACQAVSPGSFGPVAGVVAAVAGGLFVGRAGGSAWTERGRARAEVMSVENNAAGSRAILVRNPFLPVPASKLAIQKEKTIQGRR